MLNQKSFFINQGKRITKKKSNKNHIINAIFVLIFTLLFLAIIQISNFSFNYKDFKIKKINLVSDILQYEINTEKYAVKNQNQKNVSDNTNDLVSISDNDNTSDDKVFNEGYSKIDFKTSSIIDFSSKDGNGIKRFISKLIKSKNNPGKIRIAYYADSVTEGDIIIQDLRNSFQNDFGGRNVGFVPITSITSNFRKTIVHTFSDDWETASFIKNDNNYPIGISGYTYIPKIQKYDSSSDETEILKNVKSSSWVEYNAVGIYKTLQFFENVSLYYSNAPVSSYAIFTIDEKDKIIKKLETGKELKTIKINPGIAFKKVKINIISNDKFFIYGANFDDDNGVYIDNFCFRGISGVQLKYLDNELLKEFNNFLHYDLVILQYGLNITDLSNKSYLWYRGAMTDSIKNIKKALNNSNIMLISVYDVSIKNDKGEFVSNPLVPNLVREQQKIAYLTNSCFWNLYYAMGGENSMVNFVNNNYANLDYTHLNFIGGKKVSDFLYKAFMEKF